MDLSIVFGTHNRKPYLTDCIESIRASVGDLKYEIIVADGGSTDGSREYLATQRDVLLLGEWRLEGAIKAFNKCFALARGWAVCNINDDIIFIGDCLNRAWHHLRDWQERVAQVAFCFDSAHDGKFRRGDVIHGKQCANFGISQRVIGDYVGWWGETYHTYGGDTEVSIKYWQLGWQVRHVEDCKVHHVQVRDELRRPNDAAKHFFQVWTKERVASFPPRPLISREEMAKRKLVRLW
jgi:glycosyltransferase involved in cell wall biosynthesis